MTRWTFGVAVVTLLAPAVASADEPNPLENNSLANRLQALHVRYQSPAGCPNRSWFEGAIHFRSNRIVSVPDENGAAYEANVVVVSATDGYRGELRIGPRNGEVTTREVAGPNCQTVVDALSFAISILVDPDNINSERLPSDAELERIAETARAKIAPPPPEAPPKKEEPPPPKPPPIAKDDARLQLLAEIGGGASSAVEGIAPRAHANVELRSERRVLSLYGRLGGFFQAAGEAASPSGSIAYQPTGARIDGGMLVSLTRTIRAGGGLHVTTLIMSVDATSADENLGSVRAVPSLGPVLRASWEPSAIGGAVDLTGGAHLLRERYRIDGPPTPGEVFRLPVFWGQATIGLVVRFRDL